MDVVDFVIVLVILALVVLFISAPLRHVSATGEMPESAADAAQPQILELESARDAKLRELRDAELDYRTGKLSDDDYHALDATLRAEAIEILRALDEARERAADPDAREGSLDPDPRERSSADTITG